MDRARKLPFGSPPFAAAHARAREELLLREMEERDACRRRDTISDEIWYKAPDGGRYELHRAGNIGSESAPTDVRAQTDESSLDGAGAAEHLDPMVEMENSLKWEMSSASNASTHTSAVDSLEQQEQVRTPGVAPEFISPGGESTSRLEVSSSGQLSPFAQSPSSNDSEFCSAAPSAEMEHQNGALSHMQPFTNERAETSGIAPSGMVLEVGAVQVVAVSATTSEEIFAPAVAPRCIESSIPPLRVRAGPPISTLAAVQSSSSCIPTEILHVNLSDVRSRKQSAIVAASGFTTSERNMDADARQSTSSCAMQRSLPDSKASDVAPAQLPSTNVILHAVPTNTKPTMEGIKAPATGRANSAPLTPLNVLAATSTAASPVAAVSLPVTDVGVAMPLRAAAAPPPPIKSAPCLKNQLISKYSSCADHASQMHTGPVRCSDAATQATLPAPKCVPSLRTCHFRLEGMPPLPPVTAPPEPARTAAATQTPPNLTTSYDWKTNEELAYGLGLSYHFKKDASQAQRYDAPTQSPLRTSPKPAWQNQMHANILANQQAASTKLHSAYILAESPEEPLQSHTLVLPVTPPPRLFTTNVPALVSSPEFHLDPEIAVSLSTAYRQAEATLLALWRHRIAQ